MHSQNDVAELLQHYNSHDVPYVSVQELALSKANVILLDAREFEEYHISHIKNAIPVGFNNFDIKETSLHLKDKHQPIVVYCSVGIRSEKIGK